MQYSPRIQWNNTKYTTVTQQIRLLLCSQLHFFLPVIFSAWLHRKTWTFYEKLSLWPSHPNWLESSTVEKVLFIHKMNVVTITHHFKHCNISSRVLLDSLTGWNHTDCLFAIDLFTLIPILESYFFHADIVVRQPRGAAILEGNNGHYEQGVMRSRLHCDRSYN